MTLKEISKCRHKIAFLQCNERQENKRKERFIVMPTAAGLYCCPTLLFSAIMFHSSDGDIRGVSE